MPSNSVTINALTNRITDAGYAYDLAGNMTSDGANTLTYDAENRTTNSANGGSAGTYVFDGNSLRVQKTVSGATTVYIFSGAKVIAEYASGAAPSSPSKEYLYASSQLLATLTGPPASATANYHIADHLSPRVTTDSNGTVVGQQAHFPYGEDWYASSSTTKFKFTSHERDSESGNDYAMMRTSVNRLGRFSSPDLLAGSIFNPQSLNRFAYALNDAINLADPQGLDICPPGFICVTSWGDGGGGQGGGGGTGGTDPGGLFGGGGAGGPIRQPILDDPPDIGHGPGQGPGLLPVNGPPPPPGYAECKKALAAANKDFDAVARAEADAALIKAAASANGIDPNLLAAVGVQESGWRNRPQVGGQGAGIFQIDLGQHPAQANIAYIPAQAANWAAGLLSWNYNYMETRYGDGPDATTAYAIRSYNSWQGGVVSPGARSWATKNGMYTPLNSGTNPPLANYVTSVLGLRNCFGF